MSIFNFGNKKKLIELQNLLYNDNSNKLVHTEEELMSFAERIRRESTAAIKRDLSTVSSTIIPVSFFRSYDSVVARLSLLAQLERYISFPDRLPSEELNQFHQETEATVHALILRVLYDYCNKITDESELDKKKAYARFNALFIKVRSRLSDNNVAFIQKNCRKRIYETVEKAQAEKMPIDSCPSEIKELLEVPPNGNGKQEDELLPDALNLVVQSGSASISMIQRRLRVGYARAARLIDIMEQKGYISPADGDKPRSVLLNSGNCQETPAKESNKECQHPTEVIGNKKVDSLNDNPYICPMPYAAVVNEDDGYFLPNLDNYVIPKADASIQVQFIDNIINNASLKTVGLLLFCDSLAFNAYEANPYLCEPIITYRKAEYAINRIANELDSRKEVFAKYHLKNIYDFNSFVIMQNTSDTADNASTAGNKSEIPNYTFRHLILIVNELFSHNGKSNWEYALTYILLQGKPFGIHVVLFSKLNLSNLSLGVKADLLKAGNAEDLNEVFVKESSYKDHVSIDTIDDEMDGLHFEKYCGELLRKNGFTKITVTQSSADYGADVIAYKDEIKYAIQCKKYSSPVGISAVQEVIASKSIYGCHVAAVLTNNTFTASAESLAVKNGVLLWGREKLLAMMNHAADC